MNDAPSNLGRFKIEDLALETESWENDLIEAIARMDYLRQLGHDIRMTDTQTKRDFFWRGQ